jgi:hypothetical protein
VRVRARKQQRVWELRGGYDAAVNCEVQRLRILLAVDAFSTRLSERGQCAAAVQVVLGQRVRSINYGRLYDQPLLRESLR